MSKKLLLALWLFSAAAVAEIKVYEFKTPELERRYQNLTQELRCLVCQNQNIADSHAELAQDLRGKVYELLNKGDSDSQIVDYMTERYGDFVLYRPPLNWKTLLLWLGPALAVLFGGICFVWVLKNAKKRKNEQPDIAENELQSIRNLLDKE